jgi:hypothetical protein
MQLKASVADPNLDLDPDVWDRVRIQILAIINDHILTLIRMALDKTDQLCLNLIF